ncbi:MAG TPA: hypothetical protein VGP70_18025, partial [Actinomadura sp.]|nr:hypothetical protein [Actinomadura sp.]
MTETTGSDDASTLVTAAATEDGPTAGQHSPIERACGYCGRPVPQRPGRGRPRAYCASRDCQARAKRDRELRRATPGLEGALARAEDLYERMEQGLSATIAPLAQALESELSPRGVEARVSAARAEAQTRVAAALAEREEAGDRAVRAEKAEKAEKERAKAARQRT